MTGNQFRCKQTTQFGKSVWTTRIPLFILILLFFTSCISGGIPSIEKPEPGRNDISLVVDYGRELVQAVILDNEVPGISVVLVDHENVLWAEGFGWASKQNSQALTADSVMQLGSITKIFTAIAILQLAEQGKVDLDENLKTYLPEFNIQSRFADNDFSIRQMLSHHSGLPSDLMRGFKFYYGEQAAPDDLLDQFENLPSALNSLHMASKPGEAFSYSNLAYSLLGSVIERASGESYADYIAEHILSPLGMESSAILLPETGVQLALANGFTEEGEIEGNYLRDISAGALAASANDMGKFVQLFFVNANDVLSSNSLQMMLTAQNGNVELDGDFRFGLSFLLSELGQEPFLALHDGAVPPYHAYLRILPEEELGIVVMTNSDAGAFWVNYISSQVLDVARSAKLPTDSGVVARKESIRSEEISLTEEQAESYVGRYYAGESIGFIDVKRRRSNLTLEFLGTNLATVKMVPLEDGKFDTKLRLFGFIPLSAGLILPQFESPYFQLQHKVIEDKAYFILIASSADGQIAGLNGLVAISAERKAIDEVWLERIGTYNVVECSKSIIQSIDLSLDSQSGFLYISVANDVQLPIRFPLLTLSANQASILGVGRFGGEIIDVLPNDRIGYSGVILERE